MNASEIKCILDEEFIQNLKNEILARGRIPADVTLGKIKSMIQADYELTGGLNYILFPLNCQLTTKRLLHPVKYSSCPHPHCFELEAFIRLVQTTSKFTYNKCPICGAGVDFGDLALDDFFTGLLHSIHQYDVVEGSVRIYDNGAWARSNNKRKRKLLQSVVDVELKDVNFNHQGQSEKTVQSNSQNYGANIVQIDVDDDDDVIRIDNPVPVYHKSKEASLSSKSELNLGAKPNSSTSAQLTPVPSPSKTTTDIHTPSSLGFIKELRFKVSSPSTSLHTHKSKRRNFDEITKEFHRRNAEACRNQTLPYQNLNEQPSPR